MRKEHTMHIEIAKEGTFGNGAGSTPAGIVKRASAHDVPSHRAARLVRAFTIACALTVGGIAVAPGWLGSAAAATTTTTTKPTFVLCESVTQRNGIERKDFCNPDILRGVLDLNQVIDGTAPGKCPKIFPAPQGCGMPDGHLELSPDDILAPNREMVIVGDPLEAFLPPALGQQGAGAGEPSVSDRAAGEPRATPTKPRSDKDRKHKRGKAGKNIKGSKGKKIQSDAHKRRGHADEGHDRRHTGHTGHGEPGKRR
jgi:hypothetical protein